MRRWKGSVGIIIPQEALEEEDLQIGDRAIIRVISVQKKNGFGMFKGMNLPPYQREHDDRGF